MRPSGEIRAALRAAWPEPGAAATWREAIPLAGVNPRAPSEVRLVRQTVCNMVRAGELEPCGREKLAGEKVWRVTYQRASEPAPDVASTDAGLDALQAVTRTWATFV